MSNHKIVCNVQCTEVKDDNQIIHNDNVKYAYEFDDTDIKSSNLELHDCLHINFAQLLYKSMDLLPTEENIRFLHELNSLLACMLDRLLERSNTWKQDYLIQRVKEDIK